MHENRLLSFLSSGPCATHVNTPLSSHAVRAARRARLSRTHFHTIRPDATRVSGQCALYGRGNPGARATLAFLHSWDPRLSLGRNPTGRDALEGGGGSLKGGGGRGVRLGPPPPMVSQYLRYFHDEL